MKTSARNQFNGKVTDIEEGAVNDIVSIDIGGGHTVRATISRDSVQELQLKKGSQAVALIKATSVIVGVPD